MLSLQQRQVIDPIARMVLADASTKLQLIGRIQGHDQGERDRQIRGEANPGSSLDPMQDSRLGVGGKPCSSGRSSIRSPAWFWRMLPRSSSLSVAFSGSFKRDRQIRGEANPGSSLDPMQDSRLGVGGKQVGHQTRSHAKTTPSNCA
jgi:hypothetical protein